MRELLQGLLILGVAGWAMFLLSALWVRHRLRRRLRIAPRARSTAPTLWLVPATAAARLHRRLRRVGASARAASALDPALAHLADDLVLDAVALEPAVVALVGTGRTSGAARRRIAARVAELESVDRHLTTLASRAATPSSESMRLRDRVEALEAARREVDEIDLAAGLYSRA